MKKKRFTVTALLVSLTLGLLIYTSKNLDDSTVPRKNNGAKWRIGYYEGGPWRDYQGNLEGIIRNLMTLEWMEQTSLPDLPNAQDTSRLWQWLCTSAKSDRIAFMADAYWSADWRDDQRAQNRNAAIARLAGVKDIDLMIAAGTWAGQDLASNAHTVPTIVISASNPVQSGIVKSADDSGFDHVFAKVDPERYVRQLRLFHALVKFKRLGVVYEDTPEGRSYAAIADISAVAMEKGFEVLTCKTDFANLSTEAAMAGTIRCVRELAPKIDAFYVTDHRGQTIKAMDALLAPLIRYKVPTWAQSGSEFVKHGVLFSTTRVSYDAYGRFYADAITGLFNGKRLNDMSQVFEDPKSLAVNLNTAEKIGFTVPPAILKNAEVIRDVGGE